MKKAFTLVELLVVIGMLAVLMGGATASFAHARHQAKIAKATADIKEITNAILAYENYAGGSLDSVVGSANGEASMSTLGFITGKPSGGLDVPVLYNAQFTNGKILDPWGKPYKVRIEASSDSVYKQDNIEVTMSVFLPNWSNDGENNGEKGGK